eukprot:ctg_1134.g464
MLSGGSPGLAVTVKLGVFSCSEHTPGAGRRDTSVEGVSTGRPQNVPTSETNAGHCMVRGEVRLAGGVSSVAGSRTRRDGTGGSAAVGSRHRRKSIRMFAEANGIKGEVSGRNESLVTRRTAVMEWSSCERERMEAMVSRGAVWPFAEKLDG